MMKKYILTLFMCIITQFLWAQFRISTGNPINVACNPNEKNVVWQALELFKRDYRNVFSDSVRISESQGNIIVSTMGKNNPLMTSLQVDLSSLEGKKQGFMIKVLPDSKLLVVGSDRHGTAYGIMELSRMIGVSPWEWWADVTPRKRDFFELPENFEMVQSPSVEYRGIFINDEDWGLMQWSSLNYEPWYKSGRIGPRTNERIFELMLRLRANYYWPAMHECTEPFFLTEGNREMAEKYGIYIGGSHCEPMASSTAVEWYRRGKGEYDYVNNPNEVYKFWEERVKEISKQDILYTIGMRGVHDGQMNGAKTVEEQRKVLERVLVDQRTLLQKYVNPDITKVPQVFIPYKEVLDIYNSGLQVPEDVTLMWCDDNYGYIRHFPTVEERARKGGNGVYYHVSYWGRPHDYLWLGTFSPYLLFQQMKLAYDRGIQKMWILNVGDMKPAEYQIELFLDMAWDIEKVAKGGVGAHLESFLKREFGESIGKTLCPVMNEHYRLAYIRKPEFMGNTRVEEYRNSEYFQTVKDLSWSSAYLKQRVEDYNKLSDKVQIINSQIPDNRKDAFFQLVKYPVQSAAEMNKKMIFAQFARHGEMGWDKSDAAYDSIVSLTQIYNVGIQNNGKWNYMMDFKPRNLSVFEKVKRVSLSKSMKEERSDIVCMWNASECNSGSFIPCEGLGYEGKAVNIPKGKGINFNFLKINSDSIGIELYFLPSHPVEGEHLRFTVTLDGKETSPIHYETKGRSEEWKENVLRNQAYRRVVLPISSELENHCLEIKALDEGIILDQLILKRIFL